MDPTEPLPEELASLLELFHAGKRTALARAISVIENERPGFQEFLHRVLDAGPRAQRIGVTGPPGGGKSSLIAALAHLYRAGNEEVGVVAVDPTSPFSGGALLGDRIRMNDLANDRGIFIRSMATRGSLGGLAATSKEVIDLMDAFGLTRLLIETVGVGQTELEITGAVDTVVVVLVPESGDGIQAMKAGLMEIADIFVVNKADRPGADHVLNDLQSALHLRAGGAWAIPVLKTVAQTGEGVPELLDAVDRHREHLEESGELEVRRRGRAAVRVREVTERALRGILWGGTGTAALLEAGLDEIQRRTATPYSVAASILGVLLNGD
ncbi:MAG: methylmalonyl Co-A mutase-associated GTPase MeaB [Gemmatimonadetes bacterium]|nr:methylmalonyl Co-A mutase-associated GTPase MeaB [Gemmatimonadota bacterium]